MTAAAMFRVAASRIEAGESYDSVLADYGWVTAATVDRLRADNAALRDTRDAAAIQCSAEITRLRAENDALRVYERRYLYLRDGPWMRDDELRFTIQLQRNELWDEQIDHALNEAKEQK